MILTVSEIATHADISPVDALDQIGAAGVNAFNVEGEQYDYAGLRANTGNRYGMDDLRGASFLLTDEQASALRLSLGCQFLPGELESLMQDLGDAAVCIGNLDDPQNVNAKRLRKWQRILEPAKVEAA